MGKERNGKRCVGCGFGINQLFLQYSHGNIRLLKCDNCKSIADPYIECELMIVIIDLILHNPQAYRHLLFNLPLFTSSHSQAHHPFIWISSFTFLLLDAYRSLLLTLTDIQWNSSSFLHQILSDVFLGNILFLSAFLFVSSLFLRTSPGSHSHRFKHLFLAIIVSSYFKIFLLTMMVWEFPSTVIFIIDFFVLSSNVVAIKVMTDSALSRCVGSCLCAHAAKFFATKLFQFLML